MFRDYVYLKHHIEYITPFSMVNEAGSIKLFQVYQKCYHLQKYFTTLTIFSFYYIQKEKFNLFLNFSGEHSSIAYKKLIAKIELPNKWFCAVMNVTYVIILFGQILHFGFGRGVILYIFSDHSTFIM